MLGDVKAEHKILLSQILAHVLRLPLIAEFPGVLVSIKLFLASILDSLKQTLQGTGFNSNKHYT